MVWNDSAWEIFVYLRTYSKYFICFISIQIYLCANESQFYRDLWTNDSVDNLLIPNLSRDVTYQVQIAAQNRVGEGQRSDTLIIGRSEHKYMYFNNVCVICLLLINVLR